MRLPDSIGVRCLAGREPFPGSWLSLTLESIDKGEKAVLSFALGPARDDGRLLLRREDVLSQGRYYEQAVGLDYGRLEKRWSGRGWLAVAAAAELRHQFRLTFGKPPLRQANAYRVAAAAALRFLYEHQGERFSIEIETELPKGISFDRARTSPGDWLPERLHEPVRELLCQLARRELPALVESGQLARKAPRRLEKAIFDYGATPVIPPDIVLLLSTATRDGEDAWTIEAPLWTREEGPSDLVVQMHARELETELETELKLELRGVALAQS
jgi:hypothetical protein